MAEVSITYRQAGGGFVSRLSCGSHAEVHSHPLSGALISES